MGRKVRGELSTRRTISQMQTHWRSLISLHLPSTGEQKTHTAYKETSAGQVRASQCQVLPHAHTQTHTHLALPRFLQYCKTVVKLQRDGSIWNFSVCQHLHICYMQILITLPQVAGGKEREVGRRRMRAEETKGDEKVRRAAESIKNEKR